MARLIEIPDARGCTAPIVVQPGDVLLFRAAGGRVLSGAGAVDSLGPFQESVLGDNGEVLTPAGPPNAVLFAARRPGRASIELILGDPFHAPEKASAQVNVE